MKAMIFILSMTFAFEALAEGPSLECRASRTVRNSLGHQVLDKIEFTHDLTSTTFEDHQVGKTTVKVYMRADGLYVLVLNDNELDSSSTARGNLNSAERGVSLALSTAKISNFVVCDVK